MNRTPLEQLLLRHPEHALDAGGVADANLDMGFRPETSSLIYRLAFLKDPAHGVYRLFHVVFSNCMQLRKYRAI